MEQTDLRSELLGMMKLESEEVTIGNLKLTISELGAYDYASLWTDPENERIIGKHLVEGIEEDKTEVDMNRFVACLIVACCKDENGNSIFTSKDIDVIKNSKKEIFMKLSDVARKLNGMGVATKNSEEIPTDSSCGESQLDLDLDTPTS